MAANKLTAEDEEALCGAGTVAWNKLGPRHKEAKFTWRGTAYVAKRTSFKLSVETRDGRLIVSKPV